MPMANSYWKSNYDEMITYYPRFYREVFEMDAILRSEGSLADGIASGIDKMLLNNFIEGADEDTVTKLEEFLGLSLMKQRTLDERRRFIKSFFAGQGKVSQTRIAEMIRAYTGADTVCRFEPFDEQRNNRLDVEFQRCGEGVIYISDIYTLLAKMLPAHIEYRPMMTYRFPIGVKQKTRQHYPYGYDFSGTKPETILIAQITGIPSAVKPEISAALTDYISSSESEITGIHPDTASIARLASVEAATSSEISKAVMQYKASAESGTEAQSVLYPDVAALADNDVINAATGASSTDCSVDYVPCGTIYSGQGG